MTGKKMLKYNAKYISYVQDGESVAVFIARNLTFQVPTKGMWIDVVSIDKKGRKDNLWDFNYIIVELFPKKTKLVYSPNASEEEKHYLTWQTAHKDIEAARRHRYHGPKYKIYPYLVNRNKGQFTTEKAAWNITFGQWVPNKWFDSSCCEWREKKVPAKANWAYEVLSVQRIV